MASKPSDGSPPAKKHTKTGEMVTVKRSQNSNDTAVVSSARECLADSRISRRLEDASSAREGLGVLRGTATLCVFEANHSRSPEPSHCSVKRNHSTPPDGSEPPAKKQKNEKNNEEDEVAFIGPRNRSRSPEPPDGSKPHTKNQCMTTLNKSQISEDPLDPVDKVVFHRSADHHNGHTVLDNVTTIEVGDEKNSDSSESEEGTDCDSSSNEACVSEIETRSEVGTTELPGRDLEKALAKLGKKFEGKMNKCIWKMQKYKRKAKKYKRKAKANVGMLDKKTGYGCPCAANSLRIADINIVGQLNDKGILGETVGQTLRNFMGHRDFVGSEQDRTTCREFIKVRNSISHSRWNEKNYGLEYIQELEIKVTDIIETCLLQ